MSSSKESNDRPARQVLRQVGKQTLSKGLVNIKCWHLDRLWKKLLLAQHDVLRLARRSAGRKRISNPVSEGLSGLTFDLLLRLLPLAHACLCVVVVCSTLLVRKLLPNAGSWSAVSTGACCRTCTSALLTRRAQHAPCDKLQDFEYVREHIDILHSQTRPTQDAQYLKLWLKSKAQTN